MVNADIMLVAVGLAECFMLTRAAVLCEKIVNNKWRLLWLLPSLVCILITVSAGTEPLMAAAYLGSVGLAAGFFTDERKKRNIISAVCAAVMLLSLPCCLLSKSYRKHFDFTGDFETAVRSMKSHYALTKHKGIDFDALHDKYLPMFEQAEKDCDAVQNVIAWNCFCAEIHDGHVSYAPNDEADYKKAMKLAAGNDYGLVIVKLSDGSFAAAQVDDSLEEKGIHLGTKVKLWNGETPDKANERSLIWRMETWCDADNRDFYSGICAAGVGGDTAELTFADDSGKEQTVTLPKLSDNYYDRLKKAKETIDRGVNAPHMSWTKVNDTTAVLRIKFMMFDTDSLNKDNHLGMKNEIRKGLLELMDEGVRDVIIDIRSNGGGSGDMVKGIASLFAPEGEHYYVTNALWDEENGCYVTDAEGNYLPDDDVTFEGENILGNGRIIILVNSNSGSASDHLTKVMSGFENVTVMGFTGAGGAAQGAYSLPLSCGSVSFSGSVMLDKDGSIFIDSGKDMQAADDVGEHIPFDEQALISLFENDEDYLLNVAAEKLSKTDHK